MLRLAKRIWVPLVICWWWSFAAFCVDRFRGFFGQTVLTRPGAGLVNDPEPFNPKVVTYEIFGTGGVATINYLDLDAQPQKADERHAAVVADPDDDSSRRQRRTSSRRATVAPSPAGSPSTTCVKDERTTDGVNAQTFCLVKSA